MRDLFKVLVFGIVLFFAPCTCGAEQYRVLVLPDNIVSENDSLDSYIYNATSEFFADEVINILNQTDYIKSPTVSEERKLLKSSPSYMLPARNLTNRFKTSYNIDHVQLKKLANKSQARYALLITSSIDSENYVLRRTIWDLLNIPGATVVDPAYKISTYAALVDTQNSTVLWSNTFYKTISIVENRIITRGPSPQTEQLQKIRDYSRMLCPEIAQNVQVNVLPPETYDKESNQIYYDMGNFDNVFTKKYRRWYKEGSKDYAVAKERTNNAKESLKEKYQNYKEERAQKAEEKKIQKQMEKLEVKAEPAAETTSGSDSLLLDSQSSRSSQSETCIQNINYKKTELEDESLYYPIDIKRTRKNSLYGEYDSSRPPLRDYN